MKAAGDFPWMAALKGDPLKWLLQKANPSVRYRTLTEILDRPEDDPEVMEARQAIWRYPPVRRVLAALEQPQQPRKAPFPHKLRIRDLDILHRLAVPRGHPAIAAACDRLLNMDIQPHAGCYPEQAIAGLVRYADVDDPRLKARIRYLVRNQPFADGNRPGVLRYGWRMSCCGSHSCFSSVARSLWAAAGVPEKLRTGEVRRFIRKGAEFLAAHRLYKSNHHGFQPIRGDWLDLHLPFGLDWRTDVLDLLNVATLVGLHDDPCVVDALRFVISKQDGRGRWRLEHRYKTGRDILAARVWNEETVGRPSKWITLAAVTQLKRCQNLVTRICAGERLDSPAEPPRLPRFAPYPFPYDAADESRISAEWERLGMKSLLGKLLAFAKARALQPGWRWGFVMGPKACREWCAAEVRWIPRKGDRQSWPVCRVYFLARRGQFTAEDISRRLKIPLADEHEKARFNKMFWTSLWRVRLAGWKQDYEEVGVTLRDPKEFAGLGKIMAEALVRVTTD